MDQENMPILASNHHANLDSYISNEHGRMLRTDNVVTTCHHPLTEARAIQTPTSLYSSTTPTYTKTSQLTPRL